MNKPISQSNSGRPALSRLAGAIARIAQLNGDHITAVPALTVHRRNAPTEPLHCVYGLGLGVIAQGSKQVMLADEVIHVAPGHSMLTTIDLPVVSHVTRASVREPFLALMLTLDLRHITQLASEIELAQRPRERAYQSLSVELLDEALVDALVRLVKVLDDPALAPSLCAADSAGDHHSLAGRLARCATTAPRRGWISEPADREVRRLAQAKLHAAIARGRTGWPRAHESIHVPAAFPRHHGHQPVAVSEATAPAGSKTIDAQQESRRE